MQPTTRLGRRIERGPSYLSRLPSELRSELYRFRYRCDFEIQTVPTFSNTLNTYIQLGNGKRVAFAVDLSLLGQQLGNLREFIRSILDDQPLEDGIELTQDVELLYDQEVDQLAIGFFRPAQQQWVTFDFPVCGQAIEWLELLIELVEG
jgi:hypothetical protein